MAKKTIKEMEKKVDKALKKITQNSVSERFFDELALLSQILNGTEWELDETSFKGMTYDESRQFIKLLEKNLKREINLTTNNFSFLQLTRMIQALLIIGDTNGLYLKNPKVRFSLQLNQKVNDPFLKDTFKMVALLDK